MSKFNQVKEEYYKKLMFLKDADDSNKYGDSRDYEYCVDYSFRKIEKDFEEMQKNDDWESLESVIEDIEAQISLLEEHSFDESEAQWKEELWDNYNETRL